jgi:fatty acid desaturase
MVLRSTKVPPRLPSKFYKKSPLWSAALITTMLVVFFGSGATSCYLWLHTSLPLTVKVLLSVPLFALGGQGIHLMGFIGHEGLHFNLAKNRHLSMTLGTLFSSCTVLFIQMGMTLDHWTHHKYCNTPKDPDLRLFGKHESFLTRVLFARSSASRLYARRAFRMMIGMPLDPSLTHIVFPMKAPVMRFYCLLNFLCAAGWAALYVRIGMIDWRYLLLGFAIPFLFTNAISGLRPYAEHMGLDDGMWTNSRSRTSLFWTILDFGGNYHLEHHIYPSVPQWLLPGVHRHLREGGFFGEECNFEQTILGAYKKTFGPYPLPEGMDDWMAPAPGAGAKRRGAVAS